MYPYHDELVSTTFADSITEVSHGVVYVLSAGFMLIPFAMLIALLYAGIRERRVKKANEASSDSDVKPRAGQTP
jgi:uncharacterized membrane protein